MWDGLRSSEIFFCGPCVSLWLRRDSDWLIGTDLRFTSDVGWTEIFFCGSCVSAAQERPDWLIGTDLRFTSDVGWTEVL